MGQNANTIQVLRCELPLLLSNSVDLLLAQFGVKIPNDIHKSLAHLRSEAILHVLLSRDAKGVQGVQERVKVNLR